MSNLEERGFFERFRKDPLPAIGMGGFFGVIGYSLWNYRRRDATTKASVYVIQTRVAAQGLVIGLLTVSLGFHMYESYLNRQKPHETALNYHKYHPDKPTTSN
ncbi:unnamed protein product [Brachionus calyciflorus]|uniref:HIG1 domain-containing protein n=1 Tax=Brachionus calyciflorus TaxID=104777 RepID=A0A814GFK5_9BILA|nr:unnamed protein product [Brachionus calyciflorus]